MKSPDWKGHAHRALAEDDAANDVTTSLLPHASGTPALGRVVAEEPLVVAGLPIVAAVFGALDARYELQAGVEDGGRVGPGEVLLSFRTDAKSLLAGERVLLNYLQRLSSIATAARRVTDAIAPFGAVVTDTRKTTPGLRDVEKYAVRIGGGTNHRWSLSDAVLWKDNHWAMLAASGETLAQALARVPAGLPVQVEVETEAQLEAALGAGVGLLLIDNQPPEVLAAWKQRAGSGVVVEASGGITEVDAVAYARAGADRISMGSLTHSVPAASIRLDARVA